MLWWLLIYTKDILSNMSFYDCDRRNAINILLNEVHSISWGNFCLLKDGLLLSPFFTFSLHSLTCLFFLHPSWPYILPSAHESPFSLSVFISLLPLLVYCVFWYLDLSFIVWNCTAVLPSTLLSSLCELKEVKSFEWGLTLELH